MELGRVLSKDEIERLEIAWQDHKAAMTPIRHLVLNLLATAREQRKVVDAAREMSRRLQSLPWCNNTEGSHVLLSKSVWKDWNYGEREKLFEAIAALDEVPNEP